MAKKKIATKKITELVDSITKNVSGSAHEVNKIHHVLVYALSTYDESLRRAITDSVTKLDVRVLEDRCAYVRLEEVLNAMLTT